MSAHYTKYAELDAQIKALEAEKDEVKGFILAEMVEEGQDAVETEVGKFSVTRLKMWTYPEKVTELGDKFKAAKAKAESTGEATYVEKDSLRFTGIKL